MDNKTIARTFRLLSQLMELHGENPFKIKSIAAAAFTIDKLPVVLAEQNSDVIAQIQGIGKSTAQKIEELLSSGTIQELTDLLAITPAPILEIMTIKGLGPKKVLIIWKELGIENIGELYYACNENRLIEAKGFGLKTQDEIRRAIEFKMAGKGQFLYAQANVLAEDIFNGLTQAFTDISISFCGEFRRRCEVINSVDFLIGQQGSLAKLQTLPLFAEYKPLSENTDTLILEHPAGLKFRFFECDAANWGSELLLHTGREEHLKGLAKFIDISQQSYSSEELIYKEAGLSFIEPELREGLFEFKDTDAPLPKLIEYTDLVGTLHNHSTWSDGLNTLEEMARYCRDELQLHYLGICDHSKSAFYAKGLTEERVLAQHKEINMLNEQLAPFRIFKGIESDILFDGSLDYSDEILATFDFVVASIHSVFRMTEEKATERLIKAIENPYTTILGHPTGRLLLSREGYPVNIKKVIDACAANKVAIEINANPLRLDLDWRWHQYAIEKGVLLSVNPDAHNTKGFHDMHYGILAARKGGVSAQNCLNTFSLAEIETFFRNKKDA